MKQVKSGFDSLCGLSIGMISLTLGAYSKHYSGVYEEFITGYGLDLVYPLGHYFLSRGGVQAYFKEKTYTTMEKATAINASAIFGCCTAFEFAQYIGIKSGTFDTKDIVAYAIGTTIAVGLDLLLDKKASKLEKMLNLTNSK